MFLLKQYILGNIFFMQKTFEWTKKVCQSLLFLKLDFSKAYDKVSWVFLF
jgi:hypothetical protein